ncbi:hypothetical protein GI482_07070 [Bacillus sp. N3536]|nr:hypothetical protein GI482_07070 [Bacillus sp. N3536]
MPKSNNTLRTPDPFIMNEDTVNIAIANFLITKGFVTDNPLKGKQRGIDVKAKKDCVEIFVESKGSQKNGLTTDEVFDHGQIVNHIARQLHTLMKYASEHGTENKIYVLANPDLLRIRSEYEKVEKMIRKMEFVAMWVKKDLSIKVEGPDNLIDYLNKQNLD